MLSNLTKDQRAEVEAIVTTTMKTANLSPGQKWEVGVIVAALLGGALAIFGAAGFFFIDSTVKAVATTAAIDTRQEQVAGLLISDANFSRNVAASLAPFPQGGVVAFDLAGGCPPGWFPYSNAAGRLIVGAGQGSAGLAKRNFQELGGSETHTLSIEQLPPHNFTARVLQAGRSNVDRYNAGGRDYPVVSASESLIETNTVGRGAPFSKMPPFVVLHYCVKAP